MIAVSAVKSSHAGRQNNSSKKLEKKKGFPITRAWGLLFAHSSLGLKKCGRLLPSWPRGHPREEKQLWWSSPDKINSRDNKRSKLQALGPPKAIASSSSCPSELIADCIEFLKKSSALGGLPPTTTNVMAIIGPQQSLTPSPLVSAPVNLHLQLQDTGPKES